MEEVVTTVQLKKGFRVYIPRDLLKGLGVEEGDFITLTIKKA